MENMQQRRGRYKSSALVRGLRLQRLKDTTMSITASLDKRKAVPLAETILPEPKIFGKKNGQFSDITRLLSGGTAAAGSVASSGSAVSPPASVKKSSSMASMLSRDPSTLEPSAILPPTDPQELEDDRQVALLLNTQRRKPGKGRRAADKGLSEFEDTLTKKQRQEWKINCDAEVVRITRLLRRRHLKKKAALDGVGLFHPSANKMRMDTAFHADLKRRLQMDRIEEKTLRDMWAEFKGETKLQRKGSSSASAMEDKFASMLSMDSVSNLDGGGSSLVQDSVASVKSNASSKRNKKKMEIEKKKKDNKEKNNKRRGSATSNKKGEKGEKEVKGNMGKRGKKGKKEDSDSNSASKKVTFKPGDDVSKMEGSKIADATRTQLKNKVKKKFATGEADQEAERYENDEEEEFNEENEGSEEDEVWNGEGEEPESPMTERGDGVAGNGSRNRGVNGNNSSIQPSSSVAGSKKSTKDVTSSMGGLGDSMDIGQTLEDGSIIVDPQHPEDRYSEYEIRYDEWGQEVKVKLPPKIAPMAKTKKDTRVDPFAVFKKKKMQEYRAKKVARHKKLMAGNLTETTKEEDFVDDLGYRTSTIRQALGHGKHTPARLKEHLPNPVGNKAMERPLPGYIRNDLRMARKDAGFVDEAHEERMRNRYPQEPSHIATEPSSVPSWAVTTEASQMDPSTLGSVIEEGESIAISTVGDSVIMENSNENNANNTMENTVTTTTAPASRGQSRKRSTLRVRLEKVWEHLEMPHSHKMLFAARYAEPRRAESMNDALPMWEQAADRIQMRERLLIVMWNLRQQVRSMFIYVYIFAEVY